MFADVLTHGPRLRHSGVPLIKRGVASAFPASPMPGKVLPHILLSKLLPCICAAGGFRILAGCNVRMSARLRRLRLSRGALRPAFFFSPKSNEVSMLTLHLSRPAYCGGVPSLSFPAELAAALPTSCRVSWPMPGNLIPAGEVRHG